MEKRFTIEQIREYWTQQANVHGQQSDASWTDQYAIDLEIRQILEYLEDGDKVLDIGCANGYSSLQFAAQRRIQLRGVDYIPEMIEQANAATSYMENKLAGSVEFGIGDITDLKEPENTYDKVVVVRVVINLGNWENQRTALLNCARVLKSGGQLLLSEATLQGWKKMNHFRNEWKLPDIPMPPFNFYLDEEKVIKALSEEMELVKLVNFSSSYFVGTRIFKPLLVDFMKEKGHEINVADPLMDWNRWFSMLPPVGDYGTQKLFIFRKR